MPYAVEMLGITKVFPGIRANDNVTLRVEKGEVHALLGENGAGKSTLMSVLFGSYQPDSGIIKINGKVHKINSALESTALGIGMVHQHFKLVNNYTVTENIILGIEPRSKGFPLIVDSKNASERILKLSNKYGFNVNPNEKIENLTVCQQQKVEILKVLYRNADIIILDEPSAVLTPQEIDELMDIILRLKKEGKTILLITHKLKEIKAVADKCTILRRGKFIECVDVHKTSEDKLASLMVGRAVKFDVDKGASKPGKNVLSLKSISIKNDLGEEKVSDFTLDIREGEIVGIAGVDGNGQSELLQGMMGLLPISKGKMFLDGKDVTNATIRERIENGLGCVPEDRKKHGFVSEFSIAENFVIKDYYKNYSDRFSILNRSKAENLSEKLIRDFDIRCANGSSSLVGSMSGGNQQKVIIAREIVLEPKFLIFAQPTRGLDVGAIEGIRKKIISERDKGVAVLLISFELSEIMNLCDRIAVISHGRLTGILKAEDTNETEIGLLMAGKTKLNA